MYFNYELFTINGGLLATEITIYMAFCQCAESAQPHLTFPLATLRKFVRMRPIPFIRTSFQQLPELKIRMEDSNPGFLHYDSRGVNALYNYVLDIYCLRCQLTILQLKVCNIFFKKTIKSTFIG